MSTVNRKLTWDEVKEQFPLGAHIEGIVVRVMPFGVFVDLGVGFDGLLEVPDMAGDTRKRQEDYPQVSQRVSATVIQHTDWGRQIKLSQRA